MNQPSTQPDTSKATLYVIAVLVLCVVEVAFGFGVMVIRPNADNSALLLLVFGTLSPVQVALLAQIVQKVHLAVNSRLDQMLTLTEKASLAQGRLEGAATGSGEAREVGKAAGVEQERVRHRAQDAQLAREGNALAQSVPSPSPITIMNAEIVSPTITNAEIISPTIIGAKDAKEKP